MKKKYFENCWFYIVRGGRSRRYKHLGVCQTYKLEPVNERKCRGFDLFRD